MAQVAPGVGEGQGGPPGPSSCCTLIALSHHRSLRSVPTILWRHAAGWQRRRQKNSVVAGAGLKLWSRHRTTSPHSTAAHSPPPSLSCRRLWLICSRSTCSRCGGPSRPSYRGSSCTAASRARCSSVFVACTCSTSGRLETVAGTLPPPLCHPWRTARCLPPLRGTRAGLLCAGPLTAACPLSCRMCPSSCCWPPTSPHATGPPRTDPCLTPPTSSGGAGTRRHTTARCRQQQPGAAAGQRLCRCLACAASCLSLRCLSS